MSNRFVWGRYALQSTILDRTYLETNNDYDIPEQYITWGDEDLDSIKIYSSSRNTIAVENGKLILTSSSQAYRDGAGNAYKVSTPKTGNNDIYVGVRKNNSQYYDYVYNYNIDFDGETDSRNEIIFQAEGYYIGCRGSGDAEDGIGKVYGVQKSSTISGYTSNASSSTYPRHNYTGRITSICAVIPSLIRRCSHVQ